MTFTDWTATPSGWRRTRIGPRAACSLLNNRWFGRVRMRAVWRVRVAVPLLRPDLDSQVQRQPSLVDSFLVAPHPILPSALNSPVRSSGYGWASSDLPWISKKTIGIGNPACSRVGRFRSSHPGLSARSSSPFGCAFGRVRSHAADWLSITLKGVRTCSAYPKISRDIYSRFRVCDGGRFLSSIIAVSLAYDPK